MLIYTQNGTIEREVSTVVDVIAAFDAMLEKPFYLNHIGNNINFWGNDNPDKTGDSTFTYERLAFRLMENHNTKVWGTLFGPMVHIPLLDGSFQTDPMLSEITSDAIAYWESRCSIVSNPVIKMHYMGLVFSFKKKVTNTECDTAFLESYVKTIIEVSKDGWELPLMSTSIHLPLAMDIAKGLPHLLPGVKDEFQKHTNTAKDAHVGVWLAYFNYMVSHISDKQMFTNEEKANLVASVESRLTSLMSKDVNAEGEDKLNPFDVREVSVLLAKYYRQVNNKTEKERAVRCIESSFRQIMPYGTPMQQLAWLQEIQQFYYTYGMTDAAQALYPEIQAKGVEVKDSLQIQAYQYTVPTNIINALTSDILSGSIDEIYSHFVEKFTVKKSVATEFVKKQSMNPLAGMMGTQLLSESGMPLSKIGAPEYDKEGNEYAFGAKFIEHEAFIVRHVVETLIDKQKFTKEIIVDHIMASNLINDERKFIIERGVEYYLDNEPIVACHLLIPQIEHAICNLALRLGAQALRSNNNGGYMVQLMDKLFDVSEIKNALGEDATFYLRTLLTEQRGLNLRNMMCHGLITPMYYDITKADRIIHALLLVGGL